MENFISDEKVGTYQFEHGAEFPATPISNICYENCYYSEDPEIEES